MKAIGQVAVPQEAFLAVLESGVRGRAVAGSITSTGKEDVQNVKLFDIRRDDSHAGFIAVVNRRLADEPGNPYLAQFGPVCGPRWWACIDRGDLPVEVLSGEVAHAGPRVEEWTGEPEDVVEFVCGGQVVGYDRVGCWAAPIRVGDRVSVARTATEIPSRSGPVRYIIDLWAEWVPAHDEHRHTQPGTAPNR